MLKVWNLSLIVAAFALTTFGTFLTRGSILSSVHAFAQSAVGPLYLAFLTAVLAVGFGLIVARGPLLRSESEFDTPLSREGVFLGNNLLLGVLVLTVLVGTVFPLIDEALTGARVSVGEPYFDRTTVPVVLLLLLLMGIGPLVPWRAGSSGPLLRRLRAPAWAGATVMVILVVLGVTDVPALLAFGLSAFVAWATVAEIARSVRAYRRANATGPLAAIGGAVRRNPRLYGGLTVHLGLVLVVVAITASSSFREQTEVSLLRGQTATFAGTTFRFDGVTSHPEPQRMVLVTHLTLLDARRPVGRLIPSLNFYPSSNDPIGTPSIRRGTPQNLFRDLYASVQSVSPGGRRATFRLYLNPGVFWLWVGGAVMVLGGLLALVPSRKRKTVAAVPVEQRSRELVEASR